VAAKVDRVFGQLLAAGFPFRQVALVDRWGGDDDAAMADDATTGFNCRPVAGTSRWSQHAYGKAIDVNPVENPSVTGGVPSPPAGAAFLDRRQVRPGMLTSGGVGVRAFAGIGWGWGGRWRSSKDWQHVSSNGR
jgi:poly-gamma-glutamate synthesis protein (capsule biosynthesis protein)